jgi:hypothetical protein
VEDIFEEQATKMSFSTNASRCQVGIHMEDWLVIRVRNFKKGLVSTLCNGKCFHELIIVIIYYVCDKFIDGASFILIMTKATILEISGPQSEAKGKEISGNVYYLPDMNIFYSFIPA